jgi:hypothetical protein
MLETQDAREQTFEEASSEGMLSPTAGERMR